MAAVVATERGRHGLLGVMCDPVAFMRAYNAAAPAYGRARSGQLPTWDESLLDRLELNDRQARTATRCQGRSRRLLDADCAEGADRTVWRRGLRRAR